MTISVGRVFPGTRAAFVVLAMASVASLAGCNRDDNRTVGEKVDAGIARTERAADTAAAKTKDAMADVKLKAELKGAAASVSTKVDDAAISAAVSAGLAMDSDLSAIKISVTTAAGVVNLKGPAPTAEAKARAGEIAKAVQGVVSVENRLDVRD